MSSDFEGSDAENLSPPSSVQSKRPLARTAAKRTVLAEMDLSDVSDQDSQGSASPPGKKAKPIKTAKRTLDQLPDTGVNGVNGVESGHKTTNKDSSETYQKLTQLEHILKRPDTYVGSIEATTRSLWVFDSESKQMVYRPVTYVPGLYKIFDEILVNAADNKQRDSSMDVIKVTIDREKNTVSVFNNGRGIPVQIHDKENIYIPELIFGHLLTSSNYDDDQRKVTGGRNGYGAKLCNIFSSEFVVETADKERGLKYKQVWTDNMSKMKKPSITKNSKGEEYTKITFVPDLAKFGISELNEDFEAILKRRVYDMAGCVRDVKVWLNGERIKIRNFKHYVEMYASAIAKESGSTATESKPTIIYENINDRWEIAFSISDGNFNQVSFVNSIATTSGGTHVNNVADQLVLKLSEQVKKKNKAAPVKPNQIKNQFFLFVNCLIENPAFSSQTKEQLTTKPSAFGSKCPIPESFTKKVMNSGVMDSILDFARMKADQAMRRADGGTKRSRITGMVKLEDASKAGTREGHKCTLILTEGDSAKSLAVAGMSVVGREYFGVFPLRGKLLNVREATMEAVMKNGEITAIKKILGLQHKKVYEDTRELRYGHLMIMTDQDHDGSHIKGLIINFLEAHFPSLLKIPGFLIEFITPIVKCVKKTNKKDEIAFFTLPEYEAWKEECENPNGYNIKYFKGLGTSTAADAKQYFGDLDLHLKKFHELQDGDPELIDMAFSKKKADDRKEWLRLFKPGTFIDHSVDLIKISDFINKELILFSMADNVRSIPSVVDGFKPGQRKVLFACFKRKLKSEIKVAALGGYVSEQTAYHHGEQSLAVTIVGMAQNFVGSNNINLLEPNGQFGTRDKGGKDAASPRYIFTDLSPLARRVFPINDDALLNYLDDDGKSIEPEWYVPIIPMVLVNGADGIGTGWSTAIPCFHPLEIVENVKRLMNGEEMNTMHPWFRGFDGDITPTAVPGKYHVSGKIRQLDDERVEIIELPVRKWILDMKEFLDSASTGTDKAPAWIQNFEEYHETNKVHFVVQMNKQDLKNAIAEGLEQRFKLLSSLVTSNMVAFDSQGRIKRYSSPEQILQEFYHIRLDYYQRRKAHMVDELSLQLDRLSNQARFVEMIISKQLVVSNRKRKDLVEELKADNFRPFPKNKSIQKEDASDETEEIEPMEASASDYDYLLGMPIWSLTQEKVEKLLGSKKEKEAELSELLKLSAKDMWRQDLAALVEEWHRTEERRLADTKHTTKKKGSNILGTKAAKKKRDMDDDADDYSPKKKTVKKTTESRKVDIKKEKPLKLKPTLPIDDTPVKIEREGMTNGDDWSHLAKGLGNHTERPMFDSKPAAAAAAAATTTTKPKKTFSIMSDSDFDEGATETAPRPMRQGRQNTKKSYADLEADSEEDDD